MIEKQLKQFYIDGIPRINCLKTGEGPPIIFLHGIGGNSSNWIEQQVYFSELFTTFSWDARGYGKSDDYKGALKFSDFSHDLLRLLGILKLGLFEKNHMFPHYWHGSLIKNHEIY